MRGNRREKGSSSNSFLTLIFSSVCPVLNQPQGSKPHTTQKIIEYLNFRFTCVPLFPPLPNFPLAGKIFRMQNLYPSREWGYFACFLPLLLCTPPHYLLKILGTPPPLHNSMVFTPSRKRGMCYVLPKICVCLCTNNNFLRCFTGTNFCC